MELHGDRVVLRSLAEADVRALAELGGDPEVARWWAGIDDAYLREELAAGLTFAILVDGEIAGMIQFYEELDDEFRHAGMDLFLGTQFQDRGLGTDAVRTMARYLVRARGHHRLIIDPAVANTRAIAAYAKAGFRPVGVMRQYERQAGGPWHDGLLMDLLRDEFVP